MRMCMYAAHRARELINEDSTAFDVAHLQYPPDLHASVPSQHVFYKRQQTRPAAIPGLDAPAGNDAAVIKAAR